LNPHEGKGKKKKRLRKGKKTEERNAPPAGNDMTLEKKKKGAPGGGHTSKKKRRGGREILWCPGEGKKKIKPNMGGKKKQLMRAQEKGREGNLLAFSVLGGGKEEESKSNKLRKREKKKKGLSLSNCRRRGKKGKAQRNFPVSRGEKEEARRILATFGKKNKSGEEEGKRTNN